MNKIMSLLKKMRYILTRPQKILCVLVFILTCLGSVLECLGVSIIIPVVNIIMNPEAIVNNQIYIDTFGRFELSYEALVIGIIFLTILVYLLKNLFFILISWVRIKFSCKVQREIAIRMMESHMSRGYQFFLNHTLGELNRGVSTDPGAIYQVLYAGFRLLSDLLTIILICIFMIFSDWMMSVAMFATASMCVLLIFFVFRKQMYRAGIRSRNYGAKANQAIYEAFQGIKDILIMRRQRNFIDEYEENQIQVQRAQCVQTVGQESPAYIIEGICVAGLMITVSVRVLSGVQAAEFVATLAAFAIGAFRILPSLGRISTVINQVVVSIPGVEAVYENMKEAENFRMEHPELQFNMRDETKLISRVSKHNNEKGFQTSLTEDCSYEFKQRLELKNISFKYQKNNKYILENINLSIEKGSSIAIIGASGTGKSTLIDILLGLLIPQQGEICVDCRPITEISGKWSKMIGYVPQTVFLSSGSIKRNVAFGISDGEIDENRVRDSLDRAELLSFVDSLPDGIETKVGDRGVRLSGGQRQRIAIARALYHNPQIMVLDEATSALDNETEEAIMSAIEALQGQVTLIIVAHRLTTIRKCDVIYEVKDRGIVVKDKNEILNGIMVDKTDITNQ